jgi:uncharacterized glyoxalase superfamily protein PhnB
VPIYFTVDTMAPYVIIDSPTNTTYNTTSIPLNVSTNENTSAWWYQYNQNGTNISFTPNTTLFAGGGNGLKYITVYANDSAGNVNSTTVYFTVNTSALYITVISPENTTYTTTNITLNTTTTANANVTYSLNGTTNQTLYTDTNSGSTNIIVSDGFYNITYFATDGVSDTNSSAIYFTVDTTPPEITVTSPTNTTYNTTSIPLNVSANENTSAWWYQYNGNGTNITFTPNTTFYAGAADGLKYVTVYTNDSVGNVNSSTVFFTIDAIAPNITVISPENTTYTTTNITLDVTTSDNANVTYSLNGTSNVSLYTDANAGSTLCNRWIA